MSRLEGRLNSAGDFHDPTKDFSEDLDKSTVDKKTEEVIKKLLMVTDIKKRDREAAMAYASIL
jgi:hypothetical protein